MRALDLARMPEDAALLPKVHVNMGITLEAEGMLISACEHYRWAAVLDCACCLPRGGCEDRCDALLLPQQLNRAWPWPSRCMQRVSFCC